MFSGKDAALERAIAADDAAALVAALAAGASVNARGRHEVTPLEYAIGTTHKRAAEELIRHKADPNLKDVEGDSAVTLAVKGYSDDPELLKMVLDAGGDPNTRTVSGNTVMSYFLGRNDLDGITFLHSRGGSVDADYDGAPMIKQMAYSGNWDAVWRLIELGARLDSPKVKDGLVGAFKNPHFPHADTPVFPYKVKVWRHLKELGLDPTPPEGM